MAFPAVVGGHWWLVTSSEATVPACSVYSVDAGTGRGGLGWDPDNTPHMPAAAQRPLRRGRCKTAPPEPVPRTGLLPPPSRGASPGPIAHSATAPWLLLGRGSHVGFSSVGSPSHRHIIITSHPRVTRRKWTSSLVQTPDQNEAPVIKRSISTRLLPHTPDTTPCTLHLGQV